MTSVYLLTSGLDGDLLAALKTEVLSVRRVRVGGGEGGRVGGECSPRAPVCFCAHGRGARCVSIGTKQASDTSGTGSVSPGSGEGTGYSGG